MDELALRYFQLIPFFGIAFTVSLFLAPWIGRLSYRLGAVDLPPDQRKVADKTRERRVHRHVPALLGGVGMLLSILITLIILGSLHNYHWGVLAGVVVVIIFGFLDDLYDLRAPEQLLFQFLAAAMVVVSGITVTSIQVAGVFIDFQSVFPR